MVTGEQMAGNQRRNNEPHHDDARAAARIGRRVAAIVAECNSRQTRVTQLHNAPAASCPGRLAAAGPGPIRSSSPPARILTAGPDPGRRDVLVSRSVALAVFGRGGGGGYLHPVRRSGCSSPSRRSASRSGGWSRWSALRCCPRPRWRAPDRGGCRLLEAARTCCQRLITRPARPGRRPGWARRGCGCAGPDLPDSLALQATSRLRS